MYHSLWGVGVTASVFLVFSSPKDVRDVVKRLPKVGVGAEYELPQSRLEHY